MMRSAPGSPPKSPNIRESMDMAATHHAEQLSPEESNVRTSTMQKKRVNSSAVFSWERAAPRNSAFLE